MGFGAQGIRARHAPILSAPVPPSQSLREMCTREHEITSQASEPRPPLAVRAVARVRHAASARGGGRRGRHGLSVIPYTHLPRLTQLHIYS